MASQRTWHKLAATAASLLVLSIVAAAGTISDLVFDLQASNDLGAGGLQAHFADMVYNAGTNAWSWTAGPTPIQNASGQEMAHLNSATLTIVRDPALNVPYRINLDFEVAAGDTTGLSGSTTHFTIATALLSFPTLPPEMLVGPAQGGRATTSFTVRDRNDDGAAFVAVGPVGAGVYTAQYNGLPPSGATFANLLHQVLASAGGQGTGGQNMPNTGYQTIAASVAGMGAQLDFTLTPCDTVGGTASYRVLPEPGAAAGLLVIAALVRWRRSR